MPLHPTVPNVQSFAMSNPVCVALHFMMQSSAELFGHTSHFSSPVAHATH